MKAASGSPGSPGEPALERARRLVASVLAGPAHPDEPQHDDLAWRGQERARGRRPDREEPDSKAVLRGERSVSDGLLQSFLHELLFDVLVERFYSGANLTRCFYGAFSLEKVASY